MNTGLVIALLAGVGVAASAGLRAFLPLFVIGLAARVGLVTLKPGGEWLAGNLALICLGTATVLEILGDKIPVLDHALDAIGTAIRPIAAAFGAYAVLVHWPTPYAQIVALLLGALALGVSLVKAKLRLGSSAATLGHANPVLSTAEDATATTLVLAALFAPLLAFVLVAAVVGIAAAWRRRRATRRAPTPV
jgi:hypothetical protein